MKTFRLIDKDARSIFKYECVLDDFTNLLISEHDSINPFWYYVYIKKGYSLQQIGWFELSSNSHINDINEEAFAVVRSYLLTMKEIRAKLENVLKEYK
jgi:hypothetical protein